MKKYLTALLLSVAGIAFAKAPEGWLDDYEVALQKAAAEKKMILADFTGSDWCKWCQKLDREVFETEEFKQKAWNKYVLLYIDTPSNPATLSEKERTQNPELVKKFRISAFPTVWILDETGKQVASVRYRECGPDAFLKMVDDIIREAPDVEKYIKPIERILAAVEAEMQRERKKVIAEVVANYKRKAADTPREEQAALMNEMKQAMENVFFDVVFVKYAPIYEKAFAEARAMTVPASMAAKKQTLIETYENKYNELKQRYDDYLIDKTPPVEIPSARQAVLSAAEQAYFERQLVAPIRRALAKETPELKQQWSGVLDVAPEMVFVLLYNPFPVEPEAFCRPIENAYKRGCRYLLPVAYAYGSRRKSLQDRRQAFNECLKALKENPEQWNPASRICFLEWAREAEADILPKAELDVLHRNAVIDFLKEADFTQDELGAVGYFIFRYFTSDIADDTILDEVKASGVEIDPWVETMILAQNALQRAWKARGDSFAEKVTPEQWKIFYAETAKAKPLLQKAYEMRPDLPQIAVAAMKADFGSRTWLNRWYERAKKSRPDYYFAYGKVLWGLRPRWCGSKSAMKSFISEVVANAGFNDLRYAWGVFSYIQDVVIEENNSDPHDRDVRVEKSEMELFRPALTGYRESNIWNRLCGDEKLMLSMTMLDVAIRLQDYDATEYWGRKFKAMNIQPSYLRWYPFGRFYIGKINIKPFLDGKGRFNLIWPTSNHLIYSFEMHRDPAAVAKGEKSVWKSWLYQRTQGSKRADKPGFDCAYGQVKSGDLSWPEGQESMNFKIELHDHQFRLWQNGQVVSEKQFINSPITASDIGFTVDGLQGITLDQAELELLDK